MKVRADTGTRLRPLLTNSSPASASDTGAASMSSRCASSIVGSQTGASSIRSSARLQSCRMRSRVTPAIFPATSSVAGPFAAEAEASKDSRPVLLTSPYEPEQGLLQCLVEGAAQLGSDDVRKLDEVLVGASFRKRVNLGASVLALVRRWRASSRRVGILD